MQDYDVKEKNALKDERQEDVFDLRELFESEEERELRLALDSDVNQKKDSIKQIHKMINLKNKEINDLNKTIDNLDKEKIELDEKLFELKKSKIQAKKENNIEKVQRIKDKIKSIETKIKFNVEEIELYEVQSVLFREKLDVLRTNLSEIVS